MSQRQLYRHEHPPARPEDLPSYLTRELRRIEQALNGLDPAATPKWRNMDISLRENPSLPADHVPEFNIFKGETRLHWLSARESLHFPADAPTSES